MPFFRGGHPLAARVRPRPVRRGLVRWAPPGQLAGPGVSMDTTALSDQFNDLTLRPLWTDLGDDPVTLAAGRAVLAPASTGRRAEIRSRYPISLLGRSMSWEWTFPAGFFTAPTDNVVKVQLLRATDLAPAMAVWVYHNGTDWEFELSIGYATEQLVDVVVTSGADWRWCRFSASTSTPRQITFHRSADGRTWTSYTANAHTFAADADLNALLMFQSAEAG